MTHTSAPNNIASPTLHASIIFTISVFIAIILMSYLFKVEIVAKGIGKVVPLGRVQVVQPEFGGQIRAIHIRDGIRVTEGEVVIELDPTNSQATLNTLEAEKERLNIERLRIELIISVLPHPDSLGDVIISQKMVEFTEFETESQVGFFNEQRALLSAELLELRDAVAQVDARIQSNEKSKAVTQAGIERIDAALTTQQERLDTSQSLLDKGTVSRANYLDVLDDFNRLAKEREIFARELDQKATLDIAYLAERSGIVSALRSSLQARRAELEARNSVLAEELVTSQRRVNNTKLIAPVSGIVDQLSVFTIGGIIEEGQELMRVVPENQEFEIEAIFPNTDVGFLEVGQRVNIKLDAYPSERFGALRGTVSNVSADAIELDDNVFGFIIRIRPETAQLETATNSYAIQPGMTAIVDVITGDRRIISYFFAPIVKVVQESLGER